MSAREKRLRIIRSSDIHVVVMAVQEMAKQIGMNTGASAALSMAVSELSTNIIKYAKSGIVTTRAVRNRDQPGIEVLVQNHGPGIEDIELAMIDNVSTSGTLGLGLPGAKRLVDEFEISSQTGKRTRVRVVKWG
jgi:serine/threonine-protein kinase RsbT